MLEAILLGVIQGLSEFLPISSSGHLALAMHLLDWREPPLVMELVVHLGTLAAVFAVYGRDLVRALAGGLRLLGALLSGRAAETYREDEGARLAAFVVIATVPTGAVAFLVKDLAEGAMGAPWVIGVLLVACGAMLLASRWVPVRELPMTPLRALAIGLVQGLAVFPGISRSGSTIVAGLALGLRRDEAARFSFVASVPAIVGASLLELDLDAVTGGGNGLQYLAAGLAAAVSGYVALRVLVGLVRRGALWWFGLYLLPLGTAAALLLR